MNPTFPNTLAVIGGPKLGLYDMRNLTQASFSTISNLKALSSVSITSSKVITSGIDGMVKVYKYPSSEKSNKTNAKDTKKQANKNQYLELAYQMKAPEGIAKFAVDPFCMNYCTVLLNGQIDLYQKSFYKDKRIRQEVLKQQGLENLTELIKKSEQSGTKEPILTSIGGMQYSEKMLAHKLGRGLRNIDRGSYKYYNRGMYAKFDPSQEIHNKHKTKFIRQEKVVNLSQYDKYMRKFQFKEALVKVLESGNSQKILGLVEQLMIQDELDTALAQFVDDASCMLLLRFLVKKMNSENCHGVVVYLAERFLELVLKRGVVSDVVNEWIQRLANKIEDEVKKEKEIDEIKMLMVGVESN